MLQRLLALLAALFALPVIADDDVVGGDDAGDGGGDGAPAGDGEDAGEGAEAAGADEGKDDDGDDDETLDALLDRRETPAPADKKAPRETREERRETALLRESIESSKATRALLESRLPPQPAGQDPQEQVDLEAIRTARAGGDESAIRGAEWAYNTNRINRDNQRKADTALFMAQETEDKASFREIKNEDPKLYARYKDKVESKLAELRSQGRNVPRTTLYDWMVGNDIRQARANGRLKTVKTRAGADGVQRADRGRTPGARSDVSGRGNGSLSRKQQIEKRLVGKRI